MKSSKGAVMVEFKLITRDVRCEIHDRKIEEIFDNILVRADFIYYYYYYFVNYFMKISGNVQVYRKRWTGFETAIT